MQGTEAGALDGMHAAVTGAGSGIGAASAMVLARAGAMVTLLGRRRERLDAQARAISEEQGVAAAETLDVTDSAAVPVAFESAVRRFGAVDILVNNAGDAESAPFGKTSLELFERMLRVNLTGAYLCTQAVLPAMLRAKRGRVVNIASTAGVKGYAYVSAYCAAKHGLVGLTRSLALETAKTGVTVNAVCPGYTETDFLDQAVSRIAAKTGRSHEAARAELAASNPMARLVTPEEVAATVAYLCLPSSAAITGQALVVAGGEVMP
ncbi:MAG TPA: SDR family NAD(P)-dependent oxidoreductase [Stellaceae bacterium]|nr:SDR family NAD(P)-dependent oxidoreductase [Stellaceae bacterium]